MSIEQQPPAGTRLLDDPLFLQDTECYSDLGLRDAGQMCLEVPGR
jgi:hypothetical protein